MGAFLINNSKSDSIVILIKYSKHGALQFSKIKGSQTFITVQSSMIMGSGKIYFVWLFFCDMCPHYALTELRGHPSLSSLSVIIYNCCYKNNDSSENAIVDMVKIMDDPLVCPKNVYTASWISMMHTTTYSSLLGNRVTTTTNNTSINILQYSRSTQWQNLINHFTLHRISFLLYPPR